MTDAESPAGLPIEPGLCGSCRYASVNATRRGTVYLRCTAAANRPELPKYPDLPVRRCAAHRPVDQEPTDRLHVTRIMAAAAETVFAALADPATHAAIDGTGWIRDSAGGAPLTAVGQIFRMPMHHAQHPDGDYETANRVEVFDPPHAIAWKTGYEQDGVLHLGEWIWRYDLTPADGGGTAVTLTYDWSRTSSATRDLIGFPPFPPDHLAHSLAHLAGLVERR